MKITRFVQSCLLIEEQNTRILIDASSEEKDRAFGKLDAVLYTHEHADHFDPELAAKFIADGVPVYANASTAKQIKGKVNEIKDGQVIKIGDFDIKVIELPHCPMPNGSYGPQNTGYLVNRKLFDPGDGKELVGLKVDNLVVPITGPDISMRDAFDFLRQVEAKVGIPVHYDKLGAKPEVYKTFAGFFPEFKFEIRPLKLGESTEI